MIWEGFGSFGLKGGEGRILILVEDAGGRMGWDGTGREPSKAHEIAPGRNPNEPAGPNIISVQFRAVSRTVKQVTTHALPTYAARGPA